MLGESVNRRGNLTGRKSILGFDPIVALCLVGILLFFIVSGAVAYLNLEMLRQDSQQLAHSQEVIIALNNLRSAAQAAETGQRGFLLTNDEKYLEPYNNATHYIPQQLDEIGRLTVDNSKQAARMGPLRQ